MKAYGESNYIRYFQPEKVEEQTLLEYRISDVSDNQRQIYINKRVHASQNKLLTLDKIADKEQYDLLKEWSSVEKYNGEIKRTQGLLELIKTPYMLTIIVNILPELSSQRRNTGAVVRS